MHRDVKYKTNENNGARPRAKITFSLTATQGVKKKRDQKVVGEWI